MEQHVQSYFSACRFATIYNIDKYTFEERVKNEQTKNVYVDFKLKDSNL